MTNALQSHFINLYSMALADSQIDTVELEMLYNIGQEKGIEKSEIDQLILNPDKVRFSYPDNLKEKIIFLYDFAKIILADGIVDKNEKEALKLFCSRFEFEEENIPNIAEFLIMAAKDKMQENDLLQIIKENLN